MMAGNHAYIIGNPVRHMYILSSTSQEKEEGKNVLTTKI